MTAKRDQNRVPTLQGVSTVDLSTPTNIAVNPVNGALQAEATVIVSAVDWGNIQGTLSDQTDLQSALDAKQDTLVSGTNIKTINSTSLLGSGDITISASPGGADTQVQFNNGGSFGGSANLIFVELPTPTLTVGVPGSGIMINSDAIQPEAGVTQLSLRGKAATVGDDTGGNAALLAGWNLDSSVAGAELYLYGGSAIAPGEPGYAVLYSQDNVQSGGAIFNTAALDTDKTFSFPNASGIFSLRSSATLTVAASDSLSKDGANYICDGTADDVQIQAAIDALPAGGGRVVLMEGTFNIAASIVIAKSNVTIEGQGNGTIIFLTNTSNSQIFTLGDGALTYNYIKIKNLKINGNKANNASGLDGIYLNANTEDTEISGVYILNPKRYGIYLDNPTPRSSVHDCTIEGTGNDSLEIYGTNSIFKANTILSSLGIGIGIYADGCIVEGNIVKSSDGAGIQIWGNNNILVSGNYIYQGADYGIQVQTGTANSVIGNIIDSPAVACAKISGNNTIFSNNTLYILNDPSDTYGIRLSAVGGVTSGNVIRVDTGNTVALSGTIYCTGQYLNINNNSIEFNTSLAHIGIATASGDDLTIVGNLIKYNAYTTGSKAFDLSGGPFSCTLTGNEAYQAEYGIDASFAYETIISANSLIYMDKGILLTSCTEINVTDNYLYSRSATASSYGIKAINSARKDHVDVKGNIIERFAEDGISLQSIGYSKISNNTITDCGQKTDNTYDGILITSTGVAYSIYNIILGNEIESSGANNMLYGIRENSANDGPNIITNNIVLNAQTAQISTQHASTDVSHNITA